MEALLDEGNNDSGRSREIIDELRQVALGIHDRVVCNFEVHFFMTNTPGMSGTGGAVLPPPSSFASGTLPARKSLARMLSRARKGFEFIRQFDGIVFFGGYFYPERQSDGYFQRIQIVDRLFSDHWRVYVETEELRGRNRWFDRPEAGVIVLRVTGSRKHRIAARLFALAAALRCRKMYFHSVLRMHDNRFGKLLHLPLFKKAVDIHGVVPEEFRMHNDFFSALIYDKEERLAVKKAGIAIVVTDAMRKYLQQKFRGELKARTIEFPMFPSFAPYIGGRPLPDGKPIVVYAGGLHKWQQVPKMIDAIVKTSARCQHYFYCPEPDAVRAMLPDALLDRVVVDAKPHAELMKIYAQCHYGFILREDIIVNRVACPTKLVEYLAMGIIPIVDCEDIGDFKALGMQFITLSDFLASALPDEERRLQMAEQNLLVYEKLKLVRQTGARGIYDYFTSESSKMALFDRVINKARRVLPQHTLAGKWSRRAWSMVAPLARPRQVVETPPDVAPVDVESLPEQCDILVQVENFEAGGLENVVIDLNKTLEEASYSVVLLVLGNQGPAVQQAKQKNLSVVCQKYDPATHAKIIDRLRPRMVVGHYCNLGIENIHERRIPFIQVLHNIYMWFNDVERQKFSREAMLTHTFVAVSEQVKQYSVSRLGVPEAKCVVIPNGIDTTGFENARNAGVCSTLRRELGYTDNDFVFIDVGAINHQKNHLGTLRAFAETLKACSNAKLLIIGPVYEKHLLQELEDYIAHNGLQGKAVYGGSVPAIHSHLAMADAFVSGTFFEGCALTLLEALQANLPVITSEVGHASAFAGREGISLVRPPYDMTTYGGAIWEMRSNAAFEQRLAKAMIQVCQSPVRPNLSEIELGVIDRKNSYRQYLDLFAMILHEVPSLGAAALNKQQAVVESN